MKLKKRTRIFLFVSGIVIALMAGAGYYFVLSKNITFHGSKDKQYLYIPTGANFEDVVKLLSEKDYLRDKNSFRMMANSVGYANKVLPGKYKLKNKMSNFDLLRLLKSGKQEPVKLVIKGSQSMEHLMQYLGENLEIGESAITEKLNDNKFMEAYNLNKENAPCLFIPNTYEVYWNISLPRFFEKMHQAYEKFWTEERISKCKNAGLTKSEAVTLASIIEKETDKDNDLPNIAGVYINRLAKNMKLQADPTVLFALNNQTSQRVYSNMLEYDSPYNTYKYTGLPPGPICVPAIVSVDAVLNYNKHRYLYFCARGDGSGFSDFAETYKEHLLNAKKYQNYLDQKNIK